jgi:hypothetical protein
MNCKLKLPKQSIEAPINPFFANSKVYLLVKDSISLAEYFLGSNLIPPLPPPNGRLIVAHFKVIRVDKAYTSSKSQLRAYLVPPFEGILCFLCSALKAVNDSNFPSSLTNGIVNLITESVFIYF